MKRIDRGACLHAAELSSVAYSWPAEFECTKTDTQCISSIHGGFLTIAFRGTSNKKDVRQDLKRIQEKWGHGDVHAGFRQCYLSILPKLLPLLDWARGQKIPVLFTGHSLGGAIAQLAAVDNHASCITFGAPKVGDDYFSKQLSELPALYLFENACDLVPKLPVFGYSKPSKQVKTLWSLPIWIGKRPSYHSMELYQRLVTSVSANLFGGDDV